MKYYGKGVNDFAGQVFVNKKSIYEYSVWRDMLKRCYSMKNIINHQAYVDCEVSDNFLRFSYFYSFIRSIRGCGEIDESGKVFEFDKDLIISGNRIYSEESVCFLPREINCFLRKKKASRGKYPLGVHYSRGRFGAKMYINGKQIYIGYFNTPEEAFYAYKEAKENHAKELAEKWKDKIDPRAYEALMNYEVDIDD